MSIYEIFNGLVKSKKIKEGITKTKVFELIQSKLKKPLTSKQKQEVENYLQKFIIVTVFMENKDDWNTFKEAKKDFIDSDLIRTDDDDNLNKDDLKYLED